MRYSHTMQRVRDLEAATDFFCNKLGLKELRRTRGRKGSFHIGLSCRSRRPILYATAKPIRREAPVAELTYNWDAENYGEAR